MKNDRFLFKSTSEIEGNDFQIWPILANFDQRGLFRT